MADTGYQNSEQVLKDINLLSKQIDQLKSAFEQFFQGVTREQPLKLRAEVQDRVKRLSMATVQNATIKFKLSQTIARYTTLGHHWARILKEIEDGRYKRDIFIANLHERERRGGKTPEPVAAKNPEPAKDDLFASFLRAREQCGEPTAGITVDKFQKTLEQQVAALKDKVPTGKTLRFKIVIENGKSKIKAFV